jgi:hypothetical protein
LIVIYPSLSLERTVWYSVYVGGEKGKLWKSGRTKQIYPLARPLRGGRALAVLEAEQIHPITPQTPNIE